MSASVLRRGLELLSNDLKDAGKNQKKKKKSLQKASLMDQISSNKQGVRKQIRQLQATSRTPKSKATVKDKKIKNALVEYRKKHKKSHLRANLKYLLGSACKTQEDHTKKILQQNMGRLSCRRPDKPIRKTQEKSVFTEEEFQKFQEEYFSNL